MTTFELTKSKIRRKVKAIAKTDMPADWEWGLAPYHRKDPPPT
jgi:hypothetical protein